MGKLIDGDKLISTLVWGHYGIGKELAVEIAFYRKTIIWLENQLREAREQEAEHLKPQGTE